MRVVFWAPGAKALSGFLRLAVMAVLAAVVAGCAGVPNPGGGNTDALSDYFEKTYEQFAAKALAEPDLAAITVAGLGALKQVDPAVAVVGSGDSIAVGLGAQELARFSAPAPSEVAGWAAVTAEGFATLFDNSALLQAAEPEQLYDIFMAGVAPHLGEGAVYYTAEEYDWLTSYKNYYVDLLFQSVEGGIEILELDLGDDLGAAGLQVGDIITHIDGKQTSGLGGGWRDYTKRLLNGSWRNRSTLTVRRAGIAEPFEVTVKRERDRRQPYELDVRDGYVDMKLWEIGYSGVRLMRDTLADYPEPASYWDLPDDFRLSGVLIDLRPGTKRPWERDFSSDHYDKTMAALFLPEDTLVSTEVGRLEGYRVTSKTKHEDMTDGAPVVILVDGSTTGGSEIFAAAMQDLGRALVIGTTTVGFGIQSAGAVTPHKGVFSFPATHVITPDGYGTEGRGVMPNICTSRPGTTLEEVLAGLRRGEGLVDETTRSRHIEPDDKSALFAFRALCPAIPDSGGLAYDLGVAILKDPALYRDLLRQAGGG